MSPCVPPDGKVIFLLVFGGMKTHVGYKLAVPRAFSFPVERGTPGTVQLTVVVGEMKGGVAWTVWLSMYLRSVERKPSEVSFSFFIRTFFYIHKFSAFVQVVLLRVFI